MSGERNYSPLPTWNSNSTSPNKDGNGLLETRLNVEGSMTDASNEMGTSASRLKLGKPNNNKVIFHATFDDNQIIRIDEEDIELEWSKMLQYIKEGVEREETEKEKDFGEYDLF